LVVVEVELDGEAVGDAAAAGVVGIAQSAVGAAQGGGAVALEREGEAVGAGVGKLEGEIGGELLDGELAEGEAAAGLLPAAVGHLQLRPVQCRRAVELQLAG